MMRGDKSLQDGLDALDRDRAASLADEGGRAGAVLAGGEVLPRRSVSARALGAACFAFAALLVLWHEEVSMKRRTPKPRRDPDRRNPAPPAQREDPRNPLVPLHGEGEDVDDTTPTPARPLPAITPAVDDDMRDRRRAS
jgi:hypothetical protein